MPTAFLTTKFFIPSANAQHVTRPRLMHSLDESLQRKLTLVSAPAGFGKTGLLSEWSRRAQKAHLSTSVAWVTLEEGDNDPIRFWGYVFAALKRVASLEEVGQAALTLVQDGSSAAVEPAINALINALADDEALPNFVLMLDDYHVITAPIVHASLAYLIEHLPPPMHIVLASRADPALPLARLRAHGHLLEVRAHELCFTLAETHTLLNDRLQLNLAPEDVADLEHRTEGWITGLRLAALSMQARGDVHAFIREFSGTNQFVLEFLTEEVLRHHPEPIRDFLERSSILGRLSAALCQAVTAQAQAAEWLAYLQRHNLFIEPLDEVGEWYRLHPLLAEALHSQLKRTNPALIPELHQRARDWHMAQGYLHEAMRHALASGDLLWAAETVEKEYRHLLAIGEMTTLRHWLELLPPALVQSRPKSSLAHAWGLGYSGHYEELENHLRHAEAALTPEDTALRGEILALRAIAGALRGVGPRTITAVAQEALTLVGTQDALACGMAHQALGHAYRMQGQPVEAEREYESALAVGPTSSKLTVLGALLRVAQVQVMRGQLQKGAHSFRQHLDIASTYGGQVRWYAGEALIRLGDLHREWNELDIALAQVQEGMALARRVENALALLNGYFTLLHVHAARGDFVAAQAALQQAEQYTVRYDFAHLDERLATQRAWLAMLLDQPDEATRWAEAYSVQRQSPRETVADFQEILLARVWLHQKRLAEAQEVLCALRPAAEATGRGWTVLQTLVLQAVIARKQGDRPQAHALLTKALTAAEPEGYVRLFIEEGAPMQTLLSEQAHVLTTANGKAHERLSAYRHLLLGAFGGHRPAVSANQPLIEPLSAREQEVLRLMAAGASNQGIAATLVISIGTVKSHINRILGKLGVRNRTEAVVRGQALKLV